MTTPTVNLDAAVKQIRHALTQRDVTLTEVGFACDALTAISGEIRRLRELASRCAVSEAPSPTALGTGAPDVEAYIRSLPWSGGVTEDEKALVAGNIRSYHRFVFGPHRFEVSPLVDAGDYYDALASERVRTAPPQEDARRYEWGTLVGPFAIIQTIGGDFLLVDETDESRPLARFVNEDSAEVVGRWMARTEAKSILSRPSAPSSAPPQEDATTADFPRRGVEQMAIHIDELYGEGTVGALNLRNAIRAYDEMAAAKREHQRVRLGWVDFAFEIGQALNCLPSVSPWDNAHILRRVRELASRPSTPSSAPTQAVPFRSKVCPDCGFIYCCCPASAPTTEEKS